jgi:hypothetical protein
MGLMVSGAGESGSPAHWASPERESGDRSGNDEREQRISVPLSHSAAR